MQTKVTGSCLKYFAIRKTMVQSKFNLDAWFNSYNFFNFEFTCMWVTPAKIIIPQYAWKQFHSWADDGPL